MNHYLEVLEKPPPTDDPAVGYARADAIRLFHRLEQFRQAEFDFSRAWNNYLLAVELAGYCPFCRKPSKDCDGDHV